MNAYHSCGVVVGLMLSVFLAQADAQELVTISPVAMTANAPGLELTPKTIERWVAQTELTYQQLESLGVKAGKLEEPAIRGLLEGDTDWRARNFIEFLDRSVFRFDKASGNPNQSLPPSGSPSWALLASSKGFITDAVYFGGFDSERETRLRDSMRLAAQEGDKAFEGQTVAYKLLYDARQGASRTSRGYRQLAEILRHALLGREFVKNVGLVVEVRTTGKPLTLSPLSRVTMVCESMPEKRPSLLFSQRKRECSDQGVCRVESIAEVTSEPEYEVVYDQLATHGRSFLDGCVLEAVLLVDGEEIARTLPGKFTSHIPLASQ